MTTGYTPAFVPSMTPISPDDYEDVGVLDTARALVTRNKVVSLELESLDPDQRRMLEGEVYGLRVTGLSIELIAKAKNLDPETVIAIVSEKAEQSRQRTADAMHTATVLELDRLDALLASVWPEATQSGSTRSIMTALAIMERRAKLMGLDAPEMKAQLTLTAAADGADYTKLTPDELRTMYELQAKALPKLPGKRGAK